MESAVQNISSGLGLLGIPVMVVYVLAGGSIYWPRTMSNPSKGFDWALNIWSDARLLGVYLVTPGAVLVCIFSLATDTGLDHGMDILFIFVNLYYSWCWWKYDPKDKWKKRRQRLKEKVKELSGRLVVVPN